MKINEKINPKFIGTHIKHCCAEHGCKYNDKDCPVVLGLFKQAYPCDECDMSSKKDKTKRKLDTRPMITKFREFESYIFEDNNNTQYNNIIDYTYLKPDTKIDDVKKICEEAKEANFFSVCILPDFVSYAKTFLEKSNVKVCTVISFPKGNNKTIDKVNETKRAIADGADEIDMVLNYKLLMKGDDDSLEKCQKDVEEVARVCHKDGVILKVIIESGVLTYDQVKQACDICVEAGADFVKTSTGFAKVGAEIEKVKFMRKILPDYIKIKASGGIRTIDDFKLYFPYVDRIGTSSNPNKANTDNTY
jgi:deoxyribose-phosphate aldolase